MRAHARNELLEKDGSSQVGANGSILRRRVQRQLLVFLLSSTDDADKAAFVRMSARRRFQTERAQDALTWLGSMALALLDIEDYLAR